MALQAFGDESFRDHPSAGFYVLATAVLDPATIDHARAEMQALLRRFRGANTGAKLHWNQLDRQQQRRAAEQVAALPGLYVVTVGAPVPPRRQERARALCLRRLVVELRHWRGSVGALEARENVLNERDVRVATAARFALPKGSTFRIEHPFGGTEPALWIADLVAGAVREHRSGGRASRLAFDDALDTDD